MMEYLSVSLYLTQRLIRNVQSLFSWRRKKKNNPCLKSLHVSNMLHAWVDLLCSPCSLLFQTLKHLGVCFLDFLEIESIQGKVSVSGVCFHGASSWSSNGLTSCLVLGYENMPRAVIFAKQLCLAERETRSSVNLASSNYIWIQM